MRRKTKEILSDRRGAALIFVILALVLVSIFALAIASLVHGNLDQAINQESDMQAYYLALSGQDLTYSALLQKQYRTDAYGNEEEYTLVSDEYTTDAHSNIADTPTLTDTLGSADGMAGGTVTVTVTAVTNSGERWVKIVSTADLDDSDVTKTITLMFQASNPLIQMKS